MLASQELEEQLITRKKEDLKNLTVPELKEICKKMGIIGYSRMKKGELVDICCSNLEEELSHQYHKEDLESLTVPELKKICRNKGISGYSKLKKRDLIEVICSHKPKRKVKRKTTKRKSRAKRIHHWTIINKNFERSPLNFIVDGIMRILLMEEYIDYHCGCRVKIKKDFYTDQEVHEGEFNLLTSRGKRICSANFVAFKIEDWISTLYITLNTTKRKAIKESCLKTLD